MEYGNALDMLCENALMLFTAHWHIISLSPRNLAGWNLLSIGADLGLDGMQASNCENGQLASWRCTCHKFHLIPLPIYLCWNTLTCNCPIVFNKLTHCYGFTLFILIYTMLCTLCSDHCYVINCWIKWQTCYSLFHILCYWKLNPPVVQYDHVWLIHCYLLEREVEGASPRESYEMLL